MENKNLSQSDSEQVTAVHIAPTPFFANRGCHIRILNEIQGLKKQGCRVVLCTYGLGSDVEDIDVRRIWAIPGYTKTSAGFSPFKFIADFFLFFLVLKTVFQESPQIIHGHLHEGGLIGWVVSCVLFWRKISVVMDVQGSLSGELKAYGTFKNFPFLLKLFYLAERIINSMPDKIVCSSGASRQFLVDKCAADIDKVDLLEDVVPASFFVSVDKLSVRKRFGLPESNKIVIYSGSLLAGKGVDILMESIRLIVPNNPEVVFVLIGYPKEWIDEYVATYNLGENVVVPGEVSYFDLAGWLATADIAIEPKLSGSGEASGKVLHYMAIGLPIVCFNSRNNRKILEENCFASADESAASLACSIELALTDEDTGNKYGALCKNKAESCFSLDAAGKQLRLMYQGVIS